MNITISPVPKRPGRYYTRVDGRLLGEFQTPFYSGARVLQKEGVWPQEPLTMTHAGSSTICMSSTVGEAAALSLTEGNRGFRLEPYRPCPLGRL